MVQPTKIYESLTKSFFIHFDSLFYQKPNSILDWSIQIIIVLIRI